jgi:ribosome maturation factor RimP
LEVSSPGLDRPLTEARDFRFRTGETVRVEFVDSKRKKLTAQVLSATDTEVEFQHDSEIVRIPLTEIRRAKIVF